MEFAGPGTPLSENGISAAADRIGVDAARIWAVLRVETKGWGFLSDRRPQILFERHWFHRETRGAFSQTAPDISDKTPGGYGAGGTAQYDQLGRVIALDRRAGLRSTPPGASGRSWVSTPSPSAIRTWRPRWRRWWAGRTNSFVRLPDMTEAMIAQPRNAGMTSRAKRVSCSTMRSLGVPIAQAIMTWSSPGYRRSSSFR